MIFPSRTVILRNGETAIFRSPTVDDAAEMLEYLKTVCSETEFMLRYPEECTISKEEEVSFLRRVTESPNDLMILCEINGKIVGNCSLSCHSFIKTRHRADVAIGILRSHWSQGIGTAMFREMIDAARGHGIAQLELEVIEGNHRAMALYERMGFHIALCRPDSIRLKDGSRLCEYIMIKQLEDDHVSV